MKKIILEEKVGRILAIPIVAAVMALMIGGLSMSLGIMIVAVKFLMNAMAL